MGVPWFVVRIEPDSRQVVIGRREELASVRLLANGTNWLVPPPAEEFPCLAQIRYNSSAAAANAKLRDDGELEVTFVEPQFGVAPGQAVVLYEGDRVLGGGWIQSAEPATRSPSASQ
jgi:tRNA-specific 2-thiouridylase